MKLSRRQLLVTGAALATTTLAPNAMSAAAANFNLQGLDSPVNLQQYRGRVVYLDFWASWCAPCRQEAPVIEQLWPEYRERGYLFVGVNILDGKESARDFIDEFQLTFPSVYDDRGEVYLDYGVVGLPEAFFLRAGLEVATKYVGALDEESLRTQLDRLP